MVKEQEVGISQGELVERNLIDVSREISRLRSGKENADLTLKEREQLNRLHDQKDSLIIQALTLRKEGDETIRLGLWGNPDGKLHPYSRNQIVVYFLDPNLRHPRFSTRGVLAELRLRFNQDVTALIGDPDEFLEEPIKNYLSRTLAEINEVGGEIDIVSKGNDLKRKEELVRLKVSLAERLFRLRAKGLIGRKEIKITYLTHPPLRSMDLIRVNFPILGKRVGFHLLSPHNYLFPNQIERLIKEGGGYDARKIRPRHSVRGVR